MNVVWFVGFSFDVFRGLWFICIRSVGLVLIMDYFFLNGYLIFFVIFWEEFVVIVLGNRKFFDGFSNVVGEILSFVLLIL